MAILQKPIRLAGSKGSEEVVAIFDSGSTCAYIQPKPARKGQVDSWTEPVDVH